MQSKLLNLLIFSLFLQIGFPQTTPIPAHRLTGKIVLDGKIDEAAWHNIPPIIYKTQVPEFGKDPSEEAKVLLAYDDKYIYLAGNFELSDPSLLRATTYKRDAFDATTDMFGMAIDTYLDKENALGFFTAPTGLRWDGTVWNDAQGGDDFASIPLSLDWNTFWDVATTQSESGWSAEIRIPWSSLRFQDDDGTVIMGITSWWYIAAKNELAMYPLIPLKWGMMSAWKPSQMQEFRFEGIYSQKPLYIAPYILGGFQQDFDLDESETAYHSTNDPTYEAGLDIKYGLTNNLTLDLTVNTDFAQVEADDQQVNLTRFSLFFPEKRLFFQERASVFDFRFDSFNRLFYSRRIGLNDDGEQVRILGGARMVGRIGKSDIGFLNMQTGKKGDEPSENFGLLRLRQQVLNSNSYIGGILTNRTDFEGKYNRSYGLDGILRLFGDEYLTVKWAQTFEPDKANEVFSLKPARIFLDWERRRYDGFSYRLTMSRVGEDYAPGMGFELREAFTSFAPKISYGWIPGEKSKFLRYQFYSKGFWLRNRLSDKVETARGTLGLEFETKKGWFGNISLVRNQEFVPEAFDLSDEVDIPVDTYHFWQFQGFGSTPFSNLVSTFFNFNIGEFYDGKLLSFGLVPRIKLSAHFDLEGFYLLNFADFDKRNKQFTAHIAQVKMQYMLNTKFSVAAFLQYNSLEKIYVGNVRLRFNPKEGNDLFIVYNDLLNSKRDRELPRLPFSSSRAIVFKYTYTFRAEGVGRRAKG